MGDSIMEMKNVYKSLNEQKLYYEQELISVYDLLNCPNPDLLDCPPID